MMDMQMRCTMRFALTYLCVVIMNLKNFAGESTENLGWEI